MRRIIASALLALFLSLDGCPADAQGWSYEQVQAYLKYQKEAIYRCVARVRQMTSINGAQPFDAYQDGDGHVHMWTNQPQSYQFKKCMSGEGFPLDDDNKK